MPHSLLAALVIWASASMPVLPQIRVAGRVIDWSGAPIEHAEVELWSQAHRVAVRISAGDGTFAFAPLAARDLPLALVVRAIGYRPRSISVADTATVHIEVSLSAVPLPLADLIVAPKEACPRRQDPAAFGYWDRSRRHYSSTSDSTGIATRAAVSYGPVRQVGLGARPRHLLPNGVTGSAGVLRRMLRDRVAREGYAWPVTGFNDARRGWWEYAPLQSSFAAHFVDASFGASHSFAFVSQTDGRVILRFCALARRNPWIDGQLYFNSNGELSSASWMYRTRRHEEGAGGEAAFLPLDVAPKRMLLPAAGALWWQLPDSTWMQFTEFFEEWKASDADSIPQLDALGSDTGPPASR